MAVRVLMLLLCFISKSHSSLNAGTNFRPSKQAIYKDAEGPDEINKDVGGMENIINVNKETADLMPPNATRNSLGLFEFDIQLHARSHDIVFGRDPRRAYGASKDFSVLWPNGVVYYTLHSSIEDEASSKTWSAMQKAFNEYKEKTCIQFKKRTGEKDYIEFTKGNGCWSLIGRIGGKQQISLGYGCEMKGTVVHELAHALGFWHEQSRPDRDTYVRVVTKNILSGREDQFKKYSSYIDSKNSPYDYLSVMHYGPTAFSKDGTSVTLEVLDKNFRGTIGQRTGLSEEDVRQIKSLYNCPSKPQEKVDGGWSAWSLWASCSASCGQGQQWRARSCSQPSPSNGGDPCAGAARQTQTCNQKACASGVECDFDSSLCGWTSTDNLKWTRTDQPTPSNKTGPKKDATGSGYYLFVEASGVARFTKSRLQSPSIPSSLKARCLNFHYHMFGVKMGTLRVYIKGDNLNDKLIWQLSDDQGDSWKKASVPLFAGTGQFRIIFEAEIGAGFASDIAIDRILMKDSYCSLQPYTARPTTTQPPTTFTPSTITLTSTTPFSTTLKPTTTPLSQDPMSCDFATQCDWRNANNYDTIDWQIANDTTLSSNTGPPKGSSSFAYIEASSPSVQGDKAWLVSPVIPSHINYRCLMFDYSMNGATVGDLTVMFHSEQTQLLTRAWTLKGHQSTLWQRGQLLIPNGPGIKVIFEAVRGVEFTGDIAIDNIKLVSQMSCAITPSNAAVKRPTVPPTTTSPKPQSGVINVEVVSEGCLDPQVQQRTRTKVAADDTNRGFTSQIESVWRKQNKKGTKKPKRGKKKLRHSKAQYYRKFVNSQKRVVGSYLSVKFGEMDEHKALSEVTNDCSLAKASIKVNGVQHSPQKPGHNIVVVGARTGKVLYSKHYATQESYFAGLTVDEDIKKLPIDSIVIVAVQGSAKPQFVGQSELLELGAVPPLMPSEQGSWAFVGYKENENVDWVRQEYKNAGKGPSTIRVQIPLIRDNVVTTPPVTKQLTTISIIQDEMTFADGFVPLPLSWSQKVEFGAGDFSISLWFKTSGGGTLFSKIPATVHSYDDRLKMVYINNGRITAKLQSGPGFVVYGDQVTDQKWHHLALTAKKLTTLHAVSVFLDGQLEKSAYLRSVTADLPDSIVKFGMATKDFPVPSHYKGFMRNVAYKNYPMKQREVSRLYKSEMSK